MQEITIYDSNNKILTELTQWDNNVKIIIQDKRITKAYKVHFFNCNSKNALIPDFVTYANGKLITKVPDALLREPHTITGYVWVGDDDANTDSEHKSMFGFKIMVRKRPQPSNYAYNGQNEYTTFEKVLAEAEEFALQSKSYTTGGTNTRENENTDNAKYYSSQSKNSSQSASRSEQNAAASAQSASRSEQNAAASSENADQQASAAARNAYKTAEKAAEAAASVIEAESFAHGGTETRENEETDNAKYYCKQSHNNSEISKEYLGKVEEAGNEAVNAVKSALDMDKPNFQIDLSTGRLMYEGGRFMFHVNKAGHLEWGLTV